MILKYDPAVYINAEPFRSLEALAPSLMAYKKAECGCSHAEKDCVQTETTATLLSHFLSFCCHTSATAKPLMLPDFLIYYFHIGRYW